MAQIFRRIIALDYGDARIGVAGSDDLGILAYPVETIPAQPRGEALRRITAIVANRRSEIVVIGLPVRLDGTEGKAADKVRAFAALVMEILPMGTQVVFQDEFFSTKVATENLKASGKKTRHHRPIIDQAAAVVILQEYLDLLPPLLADGTNAIERLGP